MRLAVKDLFDTAGVRTTYGSAVFAEHVPDRDRDGGRLLEAAGYVNVGKTNLHEFAYGVTSQNLHYGTVPNPAAPGADVGWLERRLRGGTRRRARRRGARHRFRRLDPDPGRVLRHRGSSRLSGSFRPTASSRSPRASITPGRWHATCAGCVDADARARTGRRVEPRRALDDLGRGVAWCESPIRSCEPASRRHGVLPEPARSTFPVPARTTPLFMREVADVHRDLYEEHGELYGENISPKIERCLAVTDAKRRRRPPPARSLRARGAGCARGLRPAADADPRLRRPAGGRRRARDVRESTHPLHLPVQPARLAGARASVRRREDGLPASVQLVGRPGDDALVLAAGALLEGELER